uniref:Uncharacterized protein n=1 Tax=Rhizophora mucronata TaxID=61149 RepID=A0A2P2NDP9_RHIMU
MMTMGLGNHQVLYYTHLCLVVVPMLDPHLLKMDTGGQGLQDIVWWQISKWLAYFLLYG